MHSKRCASFLSFTYLAPSWRCNWELWSPSCRRRCPIAQICHERLASGSSCCGQHHSSAIEPRVRGLRSKIQNIARMTQLVDVLFHSVFPASISPWSYIRRPQPTLAAWLVFFPRQSNTGGGDASRCPRGWRPWLPPRFRWVEAPQLLCSVGLMVGNMDPPKQNQADNWYDWTKWTKPMHIP